MARYKQQVPIEICHGQDFGNEVMLTVEYDYTKGRKAYTPPGEYGPIDPPEPPNVYLLAIKHGNEPVPGWVMWAIPFYWIYEYLLDHHDHKSEAA